MQLKFEIEEGSQVVAEVNREVSGNERFHDVLAGVSKEIDVELEHLIAELEHEGKTLETDTLVIDVATHAVPLRVKRVCVDVHFESEQKPHRFLSKQTWGHVHRWACKHFNISKDACPNLELRDGGPTGPALNDKSRIGYFHECKQVWLVKPGPEPNGAVHGFE